MCSSVCALTCVCALPAALLGLPQGKSLLHRWKNADGSALDPSNVGNFALSKEAIPLHSSWSLLDCKVAAILMAELFRLDAGSDVKEGYETDLVRNNGKPLAFFNVKTNVQQAGDVHQDGLLDRWFQYWSAQ